MPKPPGVGNGNGGAPLPQFGSVTEDQGVVGGFLTASGDANYASGNDTGKWTPETLTGGYGTLTVDADGVWTYLADNAQAAIQSLNTGEVLVEVFTITSAKGPATVTITIHGADEPPCFTAGTLIDTPRGPRRIEDLRAGDKVRVRDGRSQPIVWAGLRRIDLRGLPEDSPLRPIRLTRSSIAPGVPSCDLLVSPMHRILWNAPQAPLLFGQSEVLVAAGQLVNGETIVIDQGAWVEYVHILFERHQIVGTHGLASESFYPGGVGAKGFEAATRDDLFAQFPMFRDTPEAYGPTARNVLKRHEAALVREMLKPRPADIDRFAA